MFLAFYPLIIFIEIFVWLILVLLSSTHLVNIPCVTLTQESLYSNNTWIDSLYFIHDERKKNNIFNILYCFCKQDIIHLTRQNVYMMISIIKVALMQIWKSFSVFVFIWKYVEDFTLKHVLPFEICVREICEKFVYNIEKQ